MADEREKDYAKLIDALGAVVLDMVLDFMLTKNLTPAELADFNTARLTGLGDWIKDRLAALPAPPVKPPIE